MTRSTAWLLLVTLASTGGAEAQSTMENSKGDAAVILPAGPLAGGVLSVNTESSSVRLAFLDRSTASPWYYGLEASGKANNGVASLFQGKDVAPGAKFAINIGRHSLGISRREGGDLNWLNLHIGYEVARFTLFDKSSEFSSQVSTRTVSSPELLVSYGHMWHGAIVLVGSVGVARQNNYEDLRPLKALQTEVLPGPAGVTRTITSEINARVGSLAESNVGVMRLNGLVVPGFVDNRLGLAFYTDTGFADDLDRGTTIGGGLHILKKGQPSQSLGAVVVEVADVFKNHPDSSLHRTLRVFVQAGVPFGFAGRP
jgi:hypothetical protein